MVGADPARRAWHPVSMPTQRPPAANPAVVTNQTSAMIASDVNVPCAPASTSPTTPGTPRQAQTTTVSTP
ncbi:hypothetical protein HMPREF0321_2493 [Dermacoccus sp. Ellin185]|nr:hypothetical protein HMPREF0321_2493 [Dermacoccus sp. Ellin185]